MLGAAFSVLEFDLCFSPNLSGFYRRKERFKAAGFWYLSNLSNAGHITKQHIDFHLSALSNDLFSKTNRDINYTGNSGI